jgi:hypothetical protein
VYYAQAHLMSKSVYVPGGLSASSAYVHPNVPANVPTDVPTSMSTTGMRMATTMSICTTKTC